MRAAAEGGAAGAGGVCGAMKDASELHPPSSRYGSSRLHGLKMTGSSDGSNLREVNRESGLGRIGIVRRPLTF